LINPLINIYLRLHFTITQSPGLFPTSNRSLSTRARDSPRDSRLDSVESRCRNRCHLHADHENRCESARTHWQSVEWRCASCVIVVALRSKSSGLRERVSILPVTRIRSVARMKSIYVLCALLAATICSLTLTANGKFRRILRVFNARSSRVT